MEKRIKTGGRKQGTPNKISTNVRECFAELISQNLENLQSDIEALEPKDRIKVIIDLAKFVIPNLKAIENNAGEVEFKTIEIKYVPTSEN